MQKPVRIGHGFAICSLRHSPLRRNGAVTAANLRKHANRTGQANEIPNVSTGMGFYRRARGFSGEPARDRAHVCERPPV
jgi:hypothetical protein